ncbi:hypothetical protein HDU84_005949 [Entophlyctis sp. JEL0112]|nr:hypothetical protein HDU84_005949 [Entophlyctis sp. JEL0112]
MKVLKALAAASPAPAAAAARDTAAHGAEVFALPTSHSRRAPSAEALALLNKSNVHGRWAWRAGFAGPRPVDIAHALQAAHGPRRGSEIMRGRFTRAEDALILDAFLTFMREHKTRSAESTDADQKRSRSNSKRRANDNVSSAKPDNGGIQNSADSINLTPPFPSGITGAIRDAVGRGRSSISIGLRLKQLLGIPIPTPLTSRYRKRKKVRAVPAAVPSTKAANREWTPAHSEALLRAVDEFGMRWTIVRAQPLLSDFPYQFIVSMYWQLMRAKVAKNSWTPEMDKALIRGVNNFWDVTSRPWLTLATTMREFQSLTPNILRERFTNHVDPVVRAKGTVYGCGQGWGAEEDKLLLDAVVGAEDANFTKAIPLSHPLLRGFSWKNIRARLDYLLRDARPFTPEEDARIVAFPETFGPKSANRRRPVWSVTLANEMPGRTRSMIKSRYFELIRYETTPKYGLITQDERLKIIEFIRREFGFDLCGMDNSKSNNNSNSDDNNINSKNGSKSKITDDGRSNGKYRDVYEFLERCSLFRNPRWNPFLMNELHRDHRDVTDEMIRIWETKGKPMEGVSRAEIFQNRYSPEELKLAVAEFLDHTEKGVPPKSDALLLEAVKDVLSNNSVSVSKEDASSSVLNVKFTEPGARSFRFDIKEFAPVHVKEPDGAGEGQEAKAIADLTAASRDLLEAFHDLAAEKKTEPASALEEISSVNTLELFRTANDRVNLHVDRLIIEATARQRNSITGDADTKNADPSAVAAVSADVVSREDLEPAGTTHGGALTKLRAARLQAYFALIAETLVDWNAVNERLAQRLDGWWFINRKYSCPPVTDASEGLEKKHKSHKIRLVYDATRCKRRWVFLKKDVWSEWMTKADF